MYDFFFFFSLVISLEERYAIPNELSIKQKSVVTRLENERVGVAQTTFVFHP